MNAAATRRLAGLNAHLSPTPSAGVLKWLSNLFGGGSEEEEDHGHGHGHGDDDHSHGHGHGDDDASDHEGSEPPAVRGVVKLCFKADEDWPGAEVQADPRHEGHYYRQRVETISVEHDEDMMSIPPSHRSECSNGRLGLPRHSDRDRCCEQWSTSRTPTTGRS